MAGLKMFVVEVAQQCDAVEVWFAHLSGMIGPAREARSSNVARLHIATAWGLRNS